MCGIVGAIDLEDRRLFDRSLLHRMATALAHRGPDGEDSHVEPGLAMAARRLALVDVEHGDQPVSDERGLRWAVQNGELYDDASLRHDLLARGHRLRTRCDTELWPHLHEEHGEAVFERASGQFAVAIWDRETRTLLLARDRFGIRPLYIAQADGWLLWASEIKALQSYGIELEFLPHRIGWYFNDKYALSNPAKQEETFFKNIYKFPSFTFFFCCLLCIVDRNLSDL